MANTLAVAFDIDTPAAPVEISINNGASWAPLTVPAAGNHKTANLLNVPAGFYDIGFIQLRGVGYSTSVVKNLASVTVAGAAVAYDTSITIPASGTATGANGVTLAAPVGTKVEFNRVASTGQLPVHLDLLVGGTIVAGLDFEGNYIGGAFRLTTPSGTVYSGTGNTFQNASNGLTLS